MKHTLYGGEGSSEWWSEVLRRDSEARKRAADVFVGRHTLSRRDWSAFLTESEIPGVLTRKAVERIAWADQIQLDEVREFSIRKAMLQEPITAIGCAAFAQTMLEKIVIPEGITVIGPKAFWGCENLREVVLPRSLKIISDDAFGQCSRLHMINLEHCNLVKIGERAFAGCSSRRFRAIKLPKRLTSISAFAFRDCSYLTKVRFGRKLNKIGYGAFWGCENLEKVRGLPGKRRLVLDEKPAGVSYAYTSYAMTLARRFRGTKYSHKRKLGECFIPLVAEGDKEYPDLPEVLAESE